METHSSILAWEIPWTEEPVGLQFMGSQRVGFNWVTEQQEGTLHEEKQASRMIQCRCWAVRCHFTNSISDADIQITF